MDDVIALRADRDEVFPSHVYDALGVPPLVWRDRIGGAVGLVSKRPEGAPNTVMTSGASRIVTDSGERIELAVEVPPSQEGAARVALALVCNDMAEKRRVPPVGVPWRNDIPFLAGTRISAIVLGASRWGRAFDEVRDEDGVLVGHVRTLRLLTDGEAAVVVEDGWDALLDRVGSVDRLLDVERESCV